MLKLLYGDELGKPLHLIADLLRSFIMAARGNDLIVADYSGIEGAVAAWFCREEWKVAAMRRLLTPEGKKEPDLYIRAAGSIYNVPPESIPKSDERRQIGKVAELSCFAAGTKVLTRRGVCSIEAVSKDDLLWDGVEWVKHDGVVANGVRPVVDVDGIAVTPDHLLLASGAWTPASQLASHAPTLFRALATGSEALLSLAQTLGQEADSSLFCCGVRADATFAARLATFFRAARRGAERAARQQAQRAESGISATTTSLLTKLTGAAFSGASRQPSTDAATRATALTGTMAGAGYVSFGAQTDARSWLTWQRCLDGISRAWNLTASTSTEATSQATCASSRSERTTQTGAASAPCSASLMRCVPVFDILNAGPRNRFTTFSRSGALIAHNCQYQGGVSAFYSMSRNYGLDLEAAYAPIWHSAGEERREKALSRYKESVTKKHPATRQLSEKAWLAAELVKVGWRSGHEAIVASWQLLQDAAWNAVADPGSRQEALGATFMVAHGFLWLKMPSGRVLAYGSPQIREVTPPWADFSQPPEKREKAPAVTVLGTEKGKLSRYALYGGLLLENIVQALARDILANGMLLVERAGYPPIMHVHDEVICEIPEGFGNDEEFARLLLTLPEPLKDIPLGVGDIHRMTRYRKA